MTRRQWYLAAALLGTGCVAPQQLGQSNKVVPTQQAAKKERPKLELVYLTPLPEALEVTRLVLEAKGIPVGKRSATELITPKVEDGESGRRAYNRYYVQGVDLGQGRSIVRVFRTQQLEQAAGGMNRSNSLPTTSFAYRNALQRFAERAQMVNEAASAGIGAGQTVEDVEQTSALQAMKEIDQQIADNAAAFDGTTNYEIEPFAFERGLRELNVEAEVTERLEATPSLELVGGQLPVPVKSLVVEDRIPVARPSQPRCTEDLPGGDALLEPGTTALVADPIGTREVPVALAQLACMATARRVPVVLGLSLPSAEQPFIDAYLRSAGEGADLAKLLTEGTFWRRSFQDGRSSQAVLGLVEHARALRAQGHDVDVLAFDSEELRGNPREEHMFQRVKAARARRPDAALVLAAGGVHVRNKKGAPWDPGFEPLGYRLTQASPAERVLVLEEAFQRGPQYACRFNSAGRVECRVYARSPTYASLHPFELPRGLELYAQPGRDGAHGRLRLGPLSASLPALRLDGVPQVAPATAGASVR